MSTSTRFNLKSLRVFPKKDTLESFILLLFTKKDHTVIYTERSYKPSPNSRMIKRLTIDNLFPRHFDILAKTRSRMTTAITFSRQNDAGSSLINTQRWENLVLEVVLVSESKALY